MEFIGIKVRTFHRPDSVSLRFPDAQNSNRERTRIDSVRAEIVRYVIGLSDEKFQVGLTIVAQLIELHWQFKLQRLDDFELPDAALRHHRAENRDDTQDPAQTVTLSDILPTIGPAHEDSFQETLSDVSLSDNDPQAIGTSENDFQIENTIAENQLSEDIPAVDALVENTDAEESIAEAAVPEAVVPEAVVPEEMVSEIGSTTQATLKDELHGLYVELVTSDNGSCTEQEAARRFYELISAYVTLPDIPENADFQSIKGSLDDLIFYREATPYFTDIASFMYLLQAHYLKRRSRK